MTRRSLDIIVPIYKNAGLTETCVRSLVANLPEIAGHEPRLILINDSPGDAEVEALLARIAKIWHPLVILRNEKNVGFVHSVNTGLDIARRDGHDTLLVNSDTQTFPGTLANLMKAAKADPQIGFACPRSNNASICSLPHFFGGSMPSAEESHRRWRDIARTLPPFHFSPTAVGFYMFIAHSVLANHGGLSEDFGVGYEEENDLVMRAGKVGTRAVMVNDSFAFHAGSASFSLLDLDLRSHKDGNLKKMANLHPEFLQLVRRYEASPHFRAERLLGGLLGDAQGRVKIVFDLTSLGKHHNGTNEQAIQVVKSMARRQSHRIRLAGVCSAESFEFHGLDKIEGLHREEPDAPGLHGVAIRMAQPFDVHHINVLEGLAPINVFSMLDCISEDCGPLAVEGQFIELWEHVARTAHGVFYNSKFSETIFLNRHPAARALPAWARPLPTKLASYRKGNRPCAGSHVFVLGNHFAHKGSVVAAQAIASAYPTMQVAVLGEVTRQQANLTSLRPGQLDQSKIDQLFFDASVVVLPSHVEGFGFGLMHALAAGRPVVARRIPATLEILATLDDVKGVFLYDTDADLVPALAQALTCDASSADDKRAMDWDDWCDELTDFCVSLTRRDDIFPRLVERIRSADLIRRAQRGDGVLPAASVATAQTAIADVPSDARSITLDALMALEGSDFVEHAYATLLLRPADPSGLKFYINELRTGLGKADILKALHTSAEGRSRDVRLEGLDDVIRQARGRRRKPFLKRLRGA
ncbi:MAG: glycosyltransferase [Burkholderiales bacterium]|jgi:GT2 family glycosyltransferase|nr:glycosyltransferase [Burkholderiales bacterium]